MNNPIYHTSPEHIIEIRSNETFDDGLFFSSHVYTMTAADTVYVYALDLDELNLIDARSLFYHEDALKLNDIVERFASIYDLTVDEAEDVISGRVWCQDAKPALQDMDAIDFSFAQQRYALECAKALGFDGVELQDEQGAAYLVSMSGRLGDLQYQGIQQ